MARVIVDLEEIIENWALEHFKSKATWREKRLLKHGHVGVEVDWRRVTTTQKEPHYVPPPPEPHDILGLPSVLYSTTYANNTAEDQMYNFKAERTSRSTCVTTVEEGVTKEHEFGFQLTTPGEIMQANAGFKREISITKSDSQSTEEELHWGVNSEVKVGAGMAAIAKMVIKEAEYTGTYTVQTTMRGVVRAMYVNKKKNNSLIKNSEGDLSEILKKTVLPKGVVTVNEKDRSIVCTTKGTCNFKYGLRQDIEVSEKRITEM